MGSSRAEFGGRSERPCASGWQANWGHRRQSVGTRWPMANSKAPAGELSKSASVGDQAIDRVGGVVGNVERAVGAGYGIYRAPPTRAIGELEA